MTVVSVELEHRPTLFTHSLQVIILYLPLKYKLIGDSVVLVTRGPKLQTSGDITVIVQCAILRAPGTWVRLYTPHKSIGDYWQEHSNVARVGLGTES